MHILRLRLKLIIVALGFGFFVYIDNQFFNCGRCHRGRQLVVLPLLLELLPFPPLLFFVLFSEVILFAIFVRPVLGHRSWLHLGVDGAVGVLRTVSGPCFAIEVVEHLAAAPLLVLGSLILVGGRFDLRYGLCRGKKLPSLPLSQPVSLPHVLLLLLFRCPVLRHWSWLHLGVDGAVGVLPAVLGSCFAVEVVEFHATALDPVLESLILVGSFLSLRC